MSRLRRTIVAALAVALGALVPPASAHGTSRTWGDCGFDSLAQETATGSQDHFVGAVYSYVAVWSPDHGNPVTATVTCDLRVDGVSQDTATGSGTGLVVFTDTVEFDVTDVQVVELCTIVDFTSDETPTQEECRGPTQTQMPPQWVIDQIDYFFRWVNWALIDYVDPVVCAAVAALAPGVPPLTVADGDLYLDNELLYDCPPYGWTPDPQPEPPVVTAPTGAGWNDGTTGFLTLANVRETGVVAATCAFRLDPAGEAEITGAAFGGATETTVRCVLRDADTGEVVYDESATGAVAALHDRVAVTATRLDVCTEGTAGADGTGEHCRLGRPHSDERD